VSFWKIVGAVFVGLWLFAFTALVAFAFLWMTFLGLLARWVKGG
jgi:hypothetical protein